jgi:hypothetical protein
VNESPIVGIGQASMSIPPGINIPVVLQYREDGSVTWRYMYTKDDPNV